MHASPIPARWLPRLPVLGVLAATGALALPQPAATAGGGDELPDILELTGVVRDFRERSDPEGHPDFERRPEDGFGLYSGNVSPELGPGRKPVFTGAGFKVIEQWRDRTGRPLCHLLYDASRGDVPGTTSVSSTGGIQSASSFAMWYDDVAGMNMSKPLSLVLHRQEGGTYVFDDQDDPRYAELEGFFPLEDQLFGNPGGRPDRNFHFTLELHSEFVYDATGKQIFRFIGDDDVWVFIDGRLVIDLGGVHASKEQTVDLTRLGLEDGETYELDFFFAERHRTESNFRIETNLLLQQGDDQPSVTAAYD